MHNIKHLKVLLIIVLLVFASFMIIGCGQTEQTDVTTEPIAEERDLFYLNLDKIINPSVVRQKERISGLYTMRFLKDGQIVELQTDRDNIAGQIDNIKAMVLTLDDEGYIKKMQSAQAALGGQFIEKALVSNVNGNTYLVDTGNGEITAAEDASIYDLTGLTAEIGAYGQVQTNDVICYYLNDTGVATQVYIIERRAEHDDKHICEHCDTPVEWISWDGTQELHEGHYCLSADVSLEQTQILSDADIVLCLNGYTLTGKNRLFELDENAKLSIIDHAGYTGTYTGSIIGGGVPVKGNEADALVGGAVYVGKSAELNIYGGNLGVSFPANKSSYVNRGGVIYSNGVLNILGGVITGGDVGYNGGAIYVGKGGTFAMSGGIVRYGTAYKQEGVSGSGRGGSIYIAGSAEHAEMTGGKLIAGVVDGYGGGIYTEHSMSISHATLCGDHIDGTTLAEYGGVLWVGGKNVVVDLKDGTLFTGGSSVEGGNIAVRNSCTINVYDGCVIQNGYSSRNGGNAGVFGLLNIVGGLITNGYSDGTGGNIYCFTNGDTTLNISGGVVSNGSGSMGGNICTNGNMSYEKGCVLNMSGGEVVNGVARTGNGGNIALRMHTVAMLTGGKIAGGTAAQQGGGLSTAYSRDSDVSTTLYVGGDIIISGNTGSDLYLVAHTDMNILESQPLTSNAKIGLAAEDPSVALVNHVYDDCLEVFTWTPGDRNLVLNKEQIFAQ